MTSRQSYTTTEDEKRYANSYFYIFKYLLFDVIVGTLTFYYEEY